MPTSLEDVFNQQGQAAPPPLSPGMLASGNLDPYNRPVLHNPDGSVSTSSTISIGTDKGEVLIPTVVEGKRLSKDEAIAHYRKTGENFGTFKDSTSADAYSLDLHNRQVKAMGLDRRGPSKGRSLEEVFAAQPVPPTLKERAGKAVAVVGKAVAPAISAAKGLNLALSEQTQEQVFGPIAQQFADSYVDFIQQGRNFQRGQGSLETLKQGANQLLDLLGIAGAWTPPVQKAVVQPIKEQIAGLGAKGDIYTQRNFEDLANIFEAAYWTVFGGVGKTPTAAGLARETANARFALKGVKEAIEPTEPKLAPVTVALDKEVGFRKVHDVVGRELLQMPPGSSTTAGAVIDSMIPHAEGYAKSFLENFSKRMDKSVPIKFREMAGGKPTTAGAYLSELHQIEIKVGAPSESDIVNTAVHEILHSTTVHMIDSLFDAELTTARTAKGAELTEVEKLGVLNHPSSPVLRELDAIIKEARVRAQKAGRLNEFYGLKGSPISAHLYTPLQVQSWDRMSLRREFLAEIFHPDGHGRLQEFLANSEKYSSAGYKWKNMLNQLGNLIGRHLGITNQNELRLLNQAMRVGTQLIAMQEKARAAGTLSKERHLFQIIAKDEDGTTITRGDMDRVTATPPAGKLIDTAGIRKAKSSLAISVEQILRSISPEALGRSAKIAASVVASRITELEQRTSAWHYGSSARQKFWRLRPDMQAEFIEKFEKGERFSDRALQKLADKYRRWGRDVYENDRRLGFDYEERDNYLFHVFEDSEGVASYFSRKYGDKWGDPGFIKERSFDLYKEAVAAGFRPRFDNPEDIMLARQHASDIAAMHAGILEDLASYGLATRKIAGGERIVKDIDAEGKVQFRVEKTKGTTQPEGTSRWRSPTGDVFWVDNHANAVLHNAFMSHSLWGDRGALGMGFRGMMTAKNTLVPIRLAMSLFHPLHVAGIDMAAGWTRATVELLSGSSDPITFTGKMLASGFNPLIEAINIPLGLAGHYRGGWRIVNAFRGKIPASELTASDAEALKYLVETGIAPEMSVQYRTNARQNFTNALLDAAASFRQVKVGGAAGDLARATWHLPWATISAMGKPIFEQWIPALKAASAVKDARSLLMRNPELVENDVARRLAMRRIGKSVDNRYGEMAYNKLFWKRWVKDLAVLNTLSLGWQLGFIREYGGGALDVGRMLTQGGRIQRLRRGELDRAIFVAQYTALGGGVAGLMTWAMTGEQPTGLDWVSPRTGEKNPDGSDQRVSTMFYSREFASLYKHIEHEGAAKGVSDLVLNKGSGLFGLMHEWATGVNGFGQEIRNPSSDAFSQLEQTLAYSLSDIEPISMKSIQDSASEDKGKTAALSVFGFTPAPKYLTETTAQAHIQTAFRNYVAPKETPFEKAEFSKDYSKLRQAYQTGSEQYGELLEKMSEENQLSAKDQRRLIRSLNSTLTAHQRMFMRLPWQEQIKLLDEMPVDERDTYLPHSNREHVRNTYVALEDRQ